MGALGGASIETDDGGRHQPSSKMQAALLSVLLLNRERSVSLDVLVDALWPGGDTAADSNRNSLRVHMSNLRRWVRGSGGDEAADIFETRGDGYALMLPSAAFDVFTFENLVATGQDHLLSNHNTAAFDSLCAALEIWASPYPELEDHEPAGSERVRLAALHDLAQDELVEAQIRRRKGADVIGSLEARLIDHPFRERSYGQLMRALYQVGRQADALATFQRARTCLLDELGLEPSIELRTIEQNILNQSMGVAPDASASQGRPAQGQSTQGQSTQGRQRSRFVGRDDELKRALSAIGSGENIIISGEAGIGKTRLMHELARQLATPTWIWTRSPSDRAAPPMWSILNALDLLAGQENQAADPPSEFERNHRVIELLKQGGPTVLVLDDFHWADEATVRFLRQLGEYDANSLTTLIGTRSAAGYMETDAGAAVLHLDRQASTIHLALTALDVRATQKLIGDVPAAEDRARQMHLRSAGNPLFLTELLSAGTDIDAVPPAISNVVLSRLDRSDPVVAAVLATAAVIDDEVEPNLTIRAGGFSAADVLAGIDRGRRMGLLVATASGADMFAHSLIRDGLAASLTDADRCRIHDRVAIEIETRVEVTARSRSRLAHHAFLALPLGSAERATSASISAGELAAQGFAFADARDHYQRAHRAADYLDDHARTLAMPAILCELGYYTMRAGDTPAGRELLMSSIGAAQVLEDDARFVRAARCLLEASSPASTNDPRVTEIVERAVDLSAGDMSEDRVALLVDLAGLRYFTHEIDQRRALCTQAIDLASEVSDRALAIAAAGTWTALYEPHAAHERLGVIATAKAAAQRSRSVDLEVLAASLEITTAFELAQIERALATLAQVQLQAKGLQSPRLMWFLQGWQVVARVRAGDLEEAEALANAGLSMWDGGGHHDSIAAYGAQLVMIRLLQDRGPEMTDLIRGMLAGEPDNHAYQAVLAYVLAQQGLAEASELVDVLLDVIVEGRLRSDALTTTTLAFVAETLHLQRGGDDRRATVLVAAIEPLTHMHTVVNAFGAGSMYWGSLHHAHGLALAAAGHHSDAAAALERAVAEHERSGAIPFLNRSRTVLAAMQAAMD